MKVSVSLPEEDVEFLDSYVRTHALASRSAVIHRAVDTLRAEVLADEYEEAYAEWGESGGAAAWEVAAGDGLE